MPLLCPAPGPCLWELIRGGHKLKIGPKTPPAEADGAKSLHFSSCRCMWLSYTCAELQLPHLSPITLPHAPHVSGRPASLFFIPKAPEAPCLGEDRSETSSPPPLAALRVNPLLAAILCIPAFGLLQRCALCVGGRGEACPLRHRGLSDGQGLGKEGR